MNEGKDIEAGELGAAVKEIEFDGKRGTIDDTTKGANQFHCGSGGASGGEEVIAKKDTLTFLDGVFVDFERVSAVLEGVGD